MVGELIMLPLRVGVRATRLWLRVAEETASVAAHGAGRLIELAASRGSDGGGASAWAPPAPPAQEHSSVREVDSRDQGRRAVGDDEHAASSAVERPPAPAASPTAPPAPREPREPREPLTQPQPVHVSEEPELVEAFAEPGAEDGAGAEIHVEEPWQGYAQMNAKQVVARLTAATPAELAAVQLFESSHRRRQTILNAVRRELRSPNGSSSRTQ